MAICDYVTLFGDSRSHAFFVRGFGCTLFYFGGTIMKVYKRFISALLVMVIVLGMIRFSILNANAAINENLSDFAVGLGIENNPYIVVTKEHLVFHKPTKNLAFL